MKLASYVHSFCAFSLFLASSAQASNHHGGSRRSHQKHHGHPKHDHELQLVCEVVSDEVASTAPASSIGAVGSGIIPVAPPRTHASIAPDSVPTTGPSSNDGPDASGPVPAEGASSGSGSDVSKIVPTKSASGNTGPDTPIASPSSSVSSDTGPDAGTQNPVQESKIATNATLNVAPKLTTNQTMTTSAANTDFWAGACVATLPRAESIPGRTYYDIAGTAKADPLKTLAGTGMNAVRVGPIERGQCVGPTDFSKLNNAKTLPQELNFELDFGCIDVQVQLAQRALAMNMRIVLTLNQGLKIPKALEGLGYADMVLEVQKEAKRQLQPFLDAKIVPDIILLENEGTDGILFKEESTGRARGVGKSPDLDNELCGQKPTGNMASFAQLAGYYKAEILAAKDAIKASGLSAANTRFGLHSHGQYVDWKEGTMHSPDRKDENALLDSSGKPCAQGVDKLVPAEIREGKVDEMLTIAGFSAYPDPMTPTNIDDPASRDATFNRLRKTLGLLQKWGEQYGRYEDGPFKGQLMLQALGVEYATSFDPVKEVKQHVAETELMWKVVAGFENMLGMLWWEPWYCRNNWEGGKATLCRHDETHFWPTDVMTAFGKGARSLVTSK